MKVHYLEPLFVESVPDQLDEGVLYISLTYSTVMHLCCCGCGTEVVTPLSPARWNITLDGETVSLWPSVGNWNQACRSHYIIRENDVIECHAWSSQRVRAGQRADRQAIDGHLEATKAIDRGCVFGRLLGWLRSHQ